MKIILPLALIITLAISLFVIKTQWDERGETLKYLMSLEVSLNKSNENLDKKNKNLLSEMYNNAKMAPEEVYPYYNRANNVKDESDGFIEYIEKIKLKLVGKQWLEENIGQNLCFLNDTNFNNRVDYFNKTRIKELFNKIESTRKKLLNQLREGDGVSLFSKDKEEISSQPFLKITNETRINFKNPTLTEIIISLSKLQNDSRNLEADIIKVLARGYSICGYSLDPLFARVIPNSNAVMVGSEYKAEIVLVGIPREFDYKVFVNDKTLPMNDNIAIYTHRPEKEGVYDWGGFIKIRLNGELREYQFKAQYQAFQIGTTMQVDNGNVIYTGLDNSVSISVPGYGHSDVIATISNGKLIKTLGWVAKVNKAGTATISAFIRMKDGTLRKCGERMFRVKNIPTPESFFGTLNSGNYNLGNLQKQKQIIARLNNFQLEWTEFKVTKYSCSYYPKAGKPDSFSVNGSEITTQIKEVISKAKSGDKIIIDEIVAKGPNGEVKLAPIVLTIQN